MQTDDKHAAPDFYVRAREQDFHTMVLRHVQSEVEFRGELTPSRQIEGASASALSGCSEWVTESDPPITAGWDWTVTASGDVQLNHHSVRTNLMLVDAQHGDLGHAVSINAIVHRLEGLAWQGCVLAVLRTRPSP
ncbi:MAG: DUF4902 domain-containing protein [Rhizobacter sp.]